MYKFTNKINNVLQKRITFIKNGLDIGSSMLEVLSVHRVMWIIVIYKYKLHQQINEQYHGKRVVIIYFQTALN